ARAARTHKPLRAGRGMDSRAENSHRARGSQRFPPAPVAARMPAVGRDIQALESGDAARAAFVRARPALARAAAVVVPDAGAAAATSGRRLLRSSASSRRAAAAAVREPARPRRNGALLAIAIGGAAVLALVAFVVARGTAGPEVAERETTARTEGALAQGPAP